MAPVVLGAVAAVAIIAVVIRLLVVRRRARRSSGVVSAWTRHPATRSPTTVRVLRDPTELADAAARAVASEEDAVRRISARMDRMSRLSRRDQSTET